MFYLTSTKILALYQSTSDGYQAKINAESGWNKKPITNQWRKAKLKIKPGLQGDLSSQSGGNYKGLWEK